MHPQELINQGRLADALAALQDLVRKDPSNAKYRVFLFQLLAVLGQWNRALTQLNVAGELDALALPMVQTYREAIQCEALRAEIFAGARAPLIFGEPEPWLVLLLEALKFDAAADLESAAAARAQAFDDAPACPGSIDGQRFDWLADADQRLGPVLEAVINGRYFWIPMQRIRRIELEAPADLRDAVWTPAAFTWTNGAQTVGLIPTRYSGTVASGDEALLLARRTEWVEEGALSGQGLGQRMLVTDAADYALMDARVIEFEVQPEGADRADEAGDMDGRRMAELAPRERLQPSLLDRLSDDEPDKTVEPRERRVLSLRTLREGVLRDLAWLLNATNLLSTVQIEKLPHVSNSVLNYGVPDISGVSVSSLNVNQIERGIRQAIWDFEPRLIRSSVSVKAVAATQADHNKLTFEIEADLWAQPYPERLHLKTELDLDSAVVQLTEAGGRSK